MKLPQITVLLLSFVAVGVTPAASQKPVRVDAVVDWPNNKIYLNAVLEVTGARLGSSNAELRRELRNELLKKLSVVTEKLVSNLAEGEGAGDVLINADLAEYWAQLKVSTYQLAENRASATLDIPLRGKGSLLAHLPLAFNSESASDRTRADASNYDQRPGMAEYDSTDLEPLLYTGLVIDARHLPFEPTLDAGIYTSSGRQIYGAAFLNRATAVRRGVAGFVSDETSADARRRAGKRPLKVSALDAARFKGNALVISDEDAARLTAHSGSRDNLRRARVVVLVPADKLRSHY